MPDAPTILGLAEAILDACVAGIDDPPERQVVTFATIPDDCELVGVAFTGARATGTSGGAPFHSPGPHSRSGAMLQTVWNFAIRVAVCVHNLDEGGNAPSEQEMAEDLELIGGIAQGVWRNVIGVVRDKELFDGCSLVSFDELVPFQQGGFGGIAWGLHVTIDRLT